MAQTAYFQFAIGSIVLEDVTPITPLAAGGTEVVDGADIIENGVDTGMPSFWASSIFPTNDLSDPLGAYYQINMIPVTATFTAPPNLDNIPVQLFDPNDHLLSISVSGVPQWRAVTVPDGYVLPGGSSDVLGGTGAPQSGTVPLTGEIASLTVHAGPWILTGTATVDDLTVDAGAVPSLVTVGSGVTVKKLTVNETYTGHPTTAGSVIPAGVVFSSLLAAGSKINFPESVTYTTSFNGTNTNIVVTATATQLIIANIEVLGNEQVGGSGTAELTVNSAVAIVGLAGGNDTIRGGTQNNIVTAHGLGNTIIEGGGNDVVNAGAGSAVVRTGSGSVLVNLNGEDNTVAGGTGNVFVNVLTGGNNTIRLGTGFDTIAEAPHGEGSNTFVLTGTNATMALYGANDVAFIHGGTDTITDNSDGLAVKIGPEGGSVTLDNFLADPDGLVRLLGGVGGYKTAKAVVAALQTDGHNGTMLSLGASGQIDFAGMALGSLHASQFRIG